MAETNQNPLSLGGHFVLDGDTYTTKQYISLESLLAVRMHDNVETTIQIKEILKSFMSADEDETDNAESSGVEDIAEEDWKAADERRGKLQILIDAKYPTRNLVKQTAEAFGKSIATIYRWRAVYIKTGKLKDIAPFHPSGGRGKSRIDKTANAIVKEVIDDFYLTKQKLKPAKVMFEVKRRCDRAKVKPPHINTLIRRIERISEREAKRSREGKDAVKKFRPAPGEFPGADYPNAVWQIDHTPVDICIVDDVYRRNIGRCWITVAIDVFSRCIVGFYLSLDKPNATSVGMCLVNAILPKEGWLSAHGINASWPVWGMPRKVHADNDKTFRCEMVSKAAKEYGFDLEWRPVRTPEWGGHIERLLGTFNQEIHTLPGTMFSNITERGAYKPHEEACLTFSELETYITQYVTGHYHVQFHKGIKRPPIKRYEAGMLGDGVVMGTGLPPPIKDPMRLRLDFLPMIERTVQSSGVVWDNISYYDPVLDPWIHACDPEHPTRKRKFICRRDPRDISVLWFLDPQKNTYFKIPYRRVEYPSINLWELRDIMAKIRKQGMEEVNEELIFDTYERQQELVSNASQATQATRKANQKKKTNKEKMKAENAQVEASRPDKPVGITAPAQGNSEIDSWDDDEVVERFIEKVRS